MREAMLAVLLMAACGGGDEDAANELGACVNWSTDLVTPTTQCAAACADFSTIGATETCTYRKGECPKGLVATFNGQKGCCDPAFDAQSPTTTQLISFEPCQ
jgi:hypothetical protein